MSDPIRVSNNLIEFAQIYLGTDSAYVWVGHGFDPDDNDDERVKKTRALMSEYYPHIPYGLNIGNRTAEGGEQPLKAVDGYYRLDVSWWPEGVYRLNYHSVPGESSPQGSQVGSERDQDVSWPLWWEGWGQKARKMARPFIHQERNGAGYCFRILIQPDRTIIPFGDLELDLA